MKLAAQFGAVVLLAIGTGCSISQPQTFTAKSSAQAGVTPSIAKPYYPDEYREHWVGIVLDRGARIRLEDGSVWEIAQKDWSQVMIWRVSQKIAVTRNVSPLYRYWLTNLNKHFTVDANLVPTEAQP